jgi:uncharacterized protein (TIGR02246 family)
MRLGSVIAAVLFVLVMHAGTARADVREEIEAANVTFVALYAAKDWKAVAALYTPDARVMGPGAETAQGREAIEAFWKGAIESGLGLISLDTQEVETAGDLAAEVGVLHLRNPDGSEITSRYVVVWKRVKGVWKLHLDIWN